MSNKVKVFFKELKTKLKESFSKGNLNPFQTPSTGGAYAGAGILAYLSELPLGTEYDAGIQLLIGIVSAVSFFIKGKKAREEEEIKG